MADRNNPFDNLDFSKLFDPGAFAADPDAALAAHKKNVEALVSAGQVVAEGYQAVARQQAELLQTAFSEAQAQFESAQAGEDRNEQLARQTEMLKSGIEQAIRNLQDSSELVRKSQTEALEILGRRAREGLDEIKERTGS